MSLPDVDLIEKKNIQVGDLYWHESDKDFYIVTSAYRSAAGLFYFRVFSQEEMKEYPLSGSEMARLFEAGIWIKQ